MTRRTVQMARPKRQSFDDWMDSGLNRLRPAQVVAFLAIAVAGAAVVFGLAWVGLAADLLLGVE